MRGDATKFDPGWRGSGGGWWLHGGAALVTVVVAIVLAFVALFVYEAEEGNIVIEPEEPPATAMFVDVSFV